MAVTSTNIEAIVRSGASWIYFTAPHRVVIAERVADVRPSIREVERLTRDFGLHAVGWLSYEAGEAFGLRVRSSGSGPATRAGTWPLAWFALFQPGNIRLLEGLPAGGGYEIGAITPATSRETFRGQFNAIREHIAAGDSYQANLTFQMTAPFSGDPRSLFADVSQAQRGQYSAYIATGEQVVCSASPELFFELDGLDVRTRPMKGTAARGLTPAEDEARRAALVGSEKERAENVMIVDMMRNDVGRIAEVGSVSVPSLFEVERYPTVWQLTSQVRARSTASLDEVFGALHPSASVTGAPKVRTMALLAEVEQEPRGIYTGAIGHVEPNGNARFSVAIRTAVVDLGSQSVHFGVGSGIVWDSKADAEYDECLLKGAVLGRRPISFDLLETIRWTADEGFFLLDRHLGRLMASAEYFDIPAEAAAMHDALSAAVAGEQGARRVRLLVTRDGQVRVEHTPLTLRQEPVRVAMAASPIDPRQVWLYHKTTHRTLYEEARQASPGTDDVLLWNDRDEVTESTVANIVAEVAGERVTPPVACGLLPGTFRAELLARGVIRERVLRISELREAPLWLINSVHEWRRAEITW